MKDLGRGVMLVNQWENAVLYRVMCDCASPEHDATIEFEIDKKFGVFLQFHKDVEYCHYDYSAPFDIKLKNFLDRFKAAFRLIFTGYLKMNSEFLIRDLDHIDSFIAALMRGRTVCAERLEELKKE